MTADVKHTDKDRVWVERAKPAVLHLLGSEQACTVMEMQARLSENIFDSRVCNYYLQPHILTLAREELRGEGIIEVDYSPTRGGQTFGTWSLKPKRGAVEAIKSAAARKRLLTARHNGWARRRSDSRNLIGQAGERALDEALRSAECPVSQVTGSTVDALGVDLARPGLGEIDNSGFIVDLSDPTAPATVFLMFEVKNTRQWYYRDHEDVLDFLHKAAHVQAERDNVLICPVFVARRVHVSLWDQGMEDGFLPARVNRQLVIADAELTEEQFEQVRVELGYVDLAIYSGPTNYHKGVVERSLPKWARSLAMKWRETHATFL